MKIRNLTPKQAITLFVCAWVVYATVAISAFGLVAYTVAHFVLKYW